MCRVVLVSDVIVLGAVLWRWDMLLVLNVGLWSR